MSLRTTAALCLRCCASPSNRCPTAGTSCTGGCARAPALARFRSCAGGAFQLAQNHVRVRSLRRARASVPVAARRGASAGAAVCGSASRTAATVHRSSGQQQQPLDHVAQLAHVARPGVALQLLHSFRLERLRASSRSAARPGARNVRQRRNVVERSRSGGRSSGKTKMRWYRSWRKAPCLTSSSRLRCVATITRTSTAIGAVAADAFHLAFFEHAQQLGLHHQRHVADLVQEQRAAVGLLELARGAACARPVKDPFSCPKSSDSISSRGHRGAIQRDERPVAPRAAFVQRARDQFLAGAGFAENTDARLAGRHAIDLGHHAPHGFARRARFRACRRAGAAAGFPPRAARSFSTLSTVSSSLSVESGFSRKSTAPSRVARTAISILAWPGNHHDRRW